MHFSDHPALAFVLVLASWLLPWLLPALLLVGCRAKAAAFYWSGVVITYLCLKVGGPLLWFILVSLRAGRPLLTEEASVAADVHLLFESELAGGSLAAGTLLAVVVLLGRRRRFSRVPHSQTA